jgi:H+/Cl- antiporter ClcA
MALVLVLVQLVVDMVVHHRTNHLHLNHQQAMVLVLVLVLVIVLVLVLVLVLEVKDSTAHHHHSIHKLLYKHIELMLKVSL